MSAYSTETLYTLSFESLTQRLAGESQDQAWRPALAHVTPSHAARCFPGSLPVATVTGLDLLMEYLPGPKPLCESTHSIDARRVKVCRTTIDEFAKILPGREVARFYQIENKIDVALRYDLAATIPVVEEAGGASAK